MTRSYEILLSEIANQSITAEEEIALARIYRDKSDGWEDARDKIVKANLPYVIKGAFNYSNNIVKVTELISEGSVALLSCLDKFDPERGFKFITFASKEIHGKMAQYVIKYHHFSNFKLSANTKTLVLKIKFFSQHFQEMNGRRPTDDEIQKELDIPLKKVIKYNSILSALEKEINTSHSYDDDSPTDIADENVASPFGQIEDEETYNALQKAISKLNPRQKLVIDKRFGLNGHSETELAVIGAELNLCKERIRQIEVASLVLIRKEMTKQKAF